MTSPDPFRWFSVVPMGALKSESQDIIHAYNSQLTSVVFTMYTTVCLDSCTSLHMDYYPACIHNDTNFYSRIFPALNDKQIYETHSPWTEILIGPARSKSIDPHAYDVAGMFCHGKDHTKVWDSGLLPPGNHTSLTHSKLPPLLAMFLVIPLLVELQLQLWRNTLEMMNLLVPNVWPSKKAALNMRGK